MIGDFLARVPFLVWFSLACVLIWWASGLFDHAVSRLRGSVPAPRDVRRAGKRREWNRVSAQHAPWIRGSRSAMATDPKARLLAPSFPNALCNGDPVNILKLSSPSATRGILQREWEITSRDELIGTLYQLLREGHRKGFERLRQRCSRPSLADWMLTRLDATARCQKEAWEKRWQIQRFQANDRGIHTLDFAAWDFIRVALLTRAGAGLGWLGEDEAWDTLALANRGLHLSYSTWDEAWEAFRTTRWLWAAEDEDQEASSDLHDRVRGEFLLGARGLWRAIPWDAPFPAPRFLLLDALAERGGLRLLSPKEVEKASSWEMELDAQARTRVPMSAGGKPITN